ncbi:MAG: hypothetical protein AB9919_06060 [Geobacteraceae bacterium]
MKCKFIIIVLLCLAAPTMAQADCSGSDWSGHRPYGDYCDGPGRGWYGAKKGVDSAGEAKRILQDYYANENVTIGKIVKKDYYFEAEILDRNNRIVDRVIVDVRTGRIRSIF